MKKQNKQREETFERVVEEKRVKFSKVHVSFNLGCLLGVFMLTLISFDESFFKIGMFTMIFAMVVNFIIYVFFTETKVYYRRIQ